MAVFVKVFLVIAISYGKLSTISHALLIRISKAVFLDSPTNAFEINL